MLVAAGQVAEAARSDLGVLRRNSGIDVLRREVERNQLLRIDPDAHGPLRTIQLRLADAGQAADLVHHVARQKITQRGFVQARVLGGQGHQQEETSGHFLHLQALLGHGPGQSRLDDLQAVLHIHLGQFRVGPGLEGGGDGGAAQAALGLEIQQVVGTVELLLDQADHAVVHGLRRSAGVHRVDFHLRRRNVGVLGYRQLGQGQGAGEKDEQGDHPGEHRAINEKPWHGSGPHWPEVWTMGCRAPAAGVTCT